MARKPIIPDHVWAMPGRELLASLEGLGSMLRVLQRNTQELSAWLSRTDDLRIALTVWDATDRRALEQHLDEVVRLFFNFAASAAARVDHYRAVKNRGHLTHDLEAAYEHRVGSFAEDGLHRWVQGVRQFMLHHRLPVARSRVRITRSEDAERFDHRTTVVVQTRELASDRRSFDATARRWMNGRDEVDLRAVVDEYDQRVRAFDDWFGPAFAAHHVDACEAYLTARNAAVAAWEREWDEPPGE